MKQNGQQNNIPLEPWKGNLRSYVVGFMLSLLLTLTAYFTVVEHLFSRWVIVLALAGLAVLQTLVQLRLFLHLGKEPKPHWNFVIFLFMGLVVAILVLGSLWIMHNLDYRVMSISDMAP